MTAKDKAKELVEKMLGDNNHYLNQNIEIDKLIAKQSALICVDEVLENISPKRISAYNPFMMNTDYWQEVKQEINKL